MSKYNVIKNVQLTITIKLRVTFYDLCHLKLNDYSIQIKFVVVDIMQYNII